MKPQIRVPGYVSPIYAPEYQFLLKRLQQAREEAGLSQQEVAAALNQTQTYVSKCETGGRRLDPVDLLYLSKLYGKSFGYFLPEVKLAKKR